MEEARGKAISKEEVFLEKPGGSRPKDGKLPRCWPGRQCYHRAKKPESSSLEKQAWLDGDGLMV